MEIAKDKSSEDPRKNPSQVHATHFTDALDGLLIYVNMDLKKMSRRRKFRGDIVV
jgi:hypothetical protein